MTGEKADVRESIDGGCSASSHAKLGISFVMNFPVIAALLNRHNNRLATEIRGDDWLDPSKEARCRKFTV